MKGISPMIATVLLIAFTVSVGALLSLWLTSFTKSSTETVGSQASTELVCSYGDISFATSPAVTYTSDTGRLTGVVENKGNIPLGNITLQIIYTNGSYQRINLNDTEGNPLVLDVGLMSSFNVSTSSNIQLVKVTTNCTAAGVSDSITSSEIQQA